MLDILSIDPIHVPLWSVWAVSAAFYPIALMMGGECDRCCSCTSCEVGQLPETVTVTLSNMPTQTKGPYLASVAVAGCFGFGATGVVEAPGGDPATDAGPITEITLTSPGQGYAKLARVIPTVTTDIPGLTVTLDLEYETCSDETLSDVPFWKVASVTVDDIGSGYTNGQAIVFEIAEGDTAEVPAQATLNTNVSAPTLAASAPGGEGATLSVNVTEVFAGDLWEITSITVIDGGEGYTDGDSVTITLAEDDVEVTPAYAIIRTKRSEPTLTATVGAPGAGASLSVTLAQETDGSGLEYWSVDAITVVSGGTGYAQDQAVLIESGDHTVVFSLTANINVDQNGVIQSVTVTDGGYYFLGSTEIDSVEVLSPGSYYHDERTAASVTVTLPGKYYREDEEGEPYVADTTVAIQQQLPSDGDGAVLSATVDDDPASPTFGQILSIDIDNGGDGYLGWQWRNTECCASHYEGKTFVLRQKLSDDADWVSGQHPKEGLRDAAACHYEHDFCGVGNLLSATGSLEVVWKGAGQLPIVRLRSENSANASSTLCDFTASPEEVISDCGTMSFVAVGPDGQTATVVAGGEYDADYVNPGGLACFVCCKGADEMPEEITATIAGGSIGGAFDGNYVLSLVSAGCPGGGFAARDCYALWEINLDDELEGEPCVIRALLYSCSQQAPLGVGFSPLVEFDPESGETVECDDCHEKCYSEVRFGIRNNFGGCAVSSSRSGAIVAAPDGRAYQDCTEICEATPQCRPKADSYDVRSAEFGNDEILATITLQ